VYYQYWDSPTASEGFNDGPNGLQRLDYVVKRAGQLHLKLLISFVDNWQYTGGMDQYLAWYGLKDHNAFFTNPRVRQDFKSWIAHLLNHINVYTGVRYRDDPTIFAWELANEPEPKALSTNVLLPWVKDISAYIKSLDQHHLVAVGSVGRDLADEVAIPTIDFGTEHLYPEHQKLTIDQSVQLLQQSISTVHRFDKPMVLEEFGYSNSNPDQASVYQTWTKTIYWRAGAGFLFWRLAAADATGRIPPDNGEGFDVHADGTATAQVLSQAAQSMRDKR
jgi:mannan endo-1,4-beta-mannosidase